MNNNHVITCHNLLNINMKRQDGGLSHVIGASNIQVKRCNRAEGDWTYNHAPMLGVWQKHLLLSYITGERDEHKPPVKVVYRISSDGESWSDEAELFPFLLAQAAPFCGPKKELLPAVAPAINHHRMCFYHSSNDLLLACSFYGLSPDGHMAPNNGYGIARVVRRIYKDFSLSPVYILKYNEAAGFNKENTVFYDGICNERLDVKYYKASKDEEFIIACDELINSKRITKQWYEEECFDKSYEAVGKAVSIYKDSDGMNIGLCKKGIGYVWDDKMKLVLEEKIPTLITATGKVWGQRKPDGQYIICYNPNEDGAHRWPLAIMTGKNGRDYYDMKALIPEIPPYRYQGNIKNLGAQYIRGICDYNGFFDEKVWLTYSTNKEDIWVTSIDDSRNYSITKHAWSYVEKNNNEFVVRDWDKCQRSIIELEVFGKSHKPAQSEKAFISIEVLSIQENNPIKLEVVSNGFIRETYEYETGKNYVTIDSDVYKDTVSVIVYSKSKLRLNTLEEDGRYGNLQDLPESEIKGKTTEFRLSYNYND